MNKMTTNLATGLSKEDYKELNAIIKEGRNSDIKEEEINEILREYKNGGHFYNHNDLLSNKEFKNCRDVGHKFKHKSYPQNGFSIRYCEIDKIYWSTQSSFGPIIEVED